LLYFKDGRIFERFSKPMRVEDKTHARVWSFLDITERTRSETERQVMYEISSAVTATDNLDQMLRQIHQSLKKVVYAENCFVALYEPDTHLFSFPYFVDQFDEKPNPVPMEKSCSAYVYRTGKPMLITNETFDRLRKENEVELVGSPSPSWVGIPLQTPFSTIGVLVLQHYSDEGIYHARDVEFLSAIGNQMALVIERKKSEDEIKRMNVQLQETIANKDKFFSIIAHDLRSPFSSFLGFTQILSEELGTMSRQEISRIAESMRTSAFNVYRLLNSLLEWSQFQRGLTSFNPEKQLLKPRVVDCLDLISDSGKRKDIEITHEIPEDATVYADKHMLDTILRNLLSNAVKFTRNGGRVFVSSRLNENRVVEISITDSGLGMDQDMLDKLFTIDEQVNRQGTNGESSSGLGLIICKEFIEKHGGKIWALSEEGKGTTFSFKLGRMPKE
ncbi:MAG: GAF domain-containing sensor histidine kinase, partial [Bacteroidales bacterium]